MNFKEWVISKLKEIHYSFPMLNIKLEVNKLSGFFFVELSPAEFFRLDRKLNNRIRDIYGEQLEKYSDQSISFISTDSIYKITNPSFQISAIDYRIVIHDALLTNTIMESFFHQHKPLFTDRIVIVSEPQVETHFEELYSSVRNNYMSKNLKITVKKHKKAGSNNTVDLAKVYG